MSHDSVERPFFRKWCSSLRILKFYPLHFCLIIILLNTVLQNSFELLHYHFLKSGHLGVSIHVLIFVFNENKRFSFSKSFQMQIKIKIIWKIMKQNWNVLKYKKQQTRKKKKKHMLKRIEKNFKNFPERSIFILYLILFSLLYSFSSVHIRFLSFLYQ